MIKFIVCPEQKCQYGVTEGNEFFNGKRHFKLSDTILVQYLDIQYRPVMISSNPSELIRI